MCIEVYHPESPLIFRYANETLQFTGQHSLTIRYAFLVQNAGSSPIGYFNVLLPRNCYYFDETEGWRLRGVRDITDQIPTFFRGCNTTEAGTLRLVQPDPNRPQFDLPPLDGQWGGIASSVISPPDAILEQGLSLLLRLGCCYFRADLHGAALDPWASRWFCWEIRVDNAGIGTKTPLGYVVMHQVASPCMVRRRLEENIEAVQRDMEATNDRWVAELCKDLRQTMGIISERRITTELHELLVQPGPSNERFLIGWDVERDLRMRSGSPRVDEDPSHESHGELLYEWKSGSLIRPDRNPWRNEGFTLHLTLVCQDSP